MNKSEKSRLKQSADYIRYLSLECIERANSGHPGLPLGCADLGVLLYRYVLNYYPEVPGWFNRDRFILSAGHGSILLYSLLHASGYDITLEDLNNFRQLNSHTAGHPEYDIELGIETTTGPLGQGFANAVGAAIEGKMLAQRFNTDDTKLFDYTIFTLMGDGCNMEGISYEAGSMAGHLGLDNLVAIYDANDISIDGRMSITFTENVGKRYEAQGWHVEHADVKDIEDVLAKLQKLKSLKQGKPKLLIVKTVIGTGLEKKKDTPGIHGAPAGIDEIVYFTQNCSIRHFFEKEYGTETVDDKEQLAQIIKERITEKKPLLAFSDAVDFIEEGVTENKKLYDRWSELYDTYQNSHHEKYKELCNYLELDVPKELWGKLINFSMGKKDATRSVSGKLLGLCAQYIPQLVGGCADLAGSTKAAIDTKKYISRDDFSGRDIAFGVREHAMGAIGNGLALGKAMIPFTSTFFTFFDYMKPAVRLAALMQLKHLFIFSHDSIYVGEDGPTHQPIEHLNALRLIPDLYTFRPANDMETAFTFLYFLTKMEGPAALVTTRQKLSEDAFNGPNGRDTDRNEWFEKFMKGGYIFYETTVGAKPDIILAASGSEVTLALETAKLLETEKKQSVRVISIPCMELLNESDQAYKDELFIPGVRVVLMETASHRAMNLFYDRNVTLLDIEDFGRSAPGDVVADYFGFTADKVLENL